MSYGGGFGMQQPPFGQQSFGRVPWRQQRVSPARRRPRPTPLLRPPASWRLERLRGCGQWGSRCCLPRRGARAAAPGAERAPERTPEKVPYYAPGRGGVFLTRRRAGRRAPSWPDRHPKARFTRACLFYERVSQPISRARLHKPAYEPSGKPRFVRIPGKAPKWTGPRGRKET